MNRSVLESKQSLAGAVRRLLVTRMRQKGFRALSRKVNLIRAALAQRNARKPVSYVVDCDLPLIYVSEPPRSGGTLFRSLLDAHPQCHVFPHEISWEKNGFRWSLDAFEGYSRSKILKQLRDTWTDHFFLNGIDRLYPFYFNRAIQRKIFYKISLDKSFEKTTRDWLGAYLTSFFNAWIDYQDLYGGERRFVAAFCPWPVEMSISDVEAFFQLYPDGFRVHILRDPHAWWASFRNFHTENREPVRAVGDHFPQRWLKAAKTGLEMCERYPDRYVVVSFDELVRFPEVSLRLFCQKVGIEFAASMLEPSLNRIAKRSNSSYTKGSYGFDASVLKRWQNILPAEEINEVNRLTGTLYERLKGRGVNSSVAS